MSRGRHRQASRLGRALPSIACTVLAFAAFAAALLTSSLDVLRILVAAVCVGACAAAVLLRQRESAAQADLDTERSARIRDEARFEERVAELEYQSEVAEEQVKRLERRVLAQRSQLAHAEAAHAQLLRDRARVAAEQAVRDAESTRALEAAKRGVRATPAAYLKAANALRWLERQAEQSESSRTPALRQPALPATVAPAKSAETSVAARKAKDERPAEQLEPTVSPKPSTGQNASESGSFFTKSKPAAAAEQPEKPEKPQKPEKSQPSAAVATSAPRERGLVAPYMQPSAQPQAAQTPTRAPAWARAALPPLRPAAAVPPQSALPRQGGTPSGAFNFFSRQEAAIGSKLGAPAEQDAADVIGEEAAAAQARYVAAPEAPSVLPTHAHERTEHAIVDLTAEDETEPIDVRAIRAV
ncbi:hypothetical protein [Streptacidiphilus melanogenes]|uniref:hypothetical protein n=1 Tax=Streptacidiphilus melanogenes TaxID=411235 RepID=UPI0005A63F6C|nr:hypothetical protein [Streptacidiphilus melanogenes]